MNKTLKRFVAGSVSTALICAGTYGGMVAYRSVNTEPVKVVSVGELNNVIHEDTYLFEDTSSSSGTVRAERIQSVFLNSTGTIDTIKVAEGDIVKKGDTLFTYDTTLTEIQYQKGEVDLDKKQLRLEKKEQTLARLRTLVPVESSAEEVEGDDFVDDEFADSLAEEPETEDETVYEPEETPQLLGGEGTRFDPYVYLWGQEDPLTAESLLQMFLPDGRRIIIPGVDTENTAGTEFASDKAVGQANDYADTDFTEQEGSPDSTAPENGFADEEGYPGNTDDNGETQDMADGDYVRDYPDETDGWGSADSYSDDPYINENFDGETDGDGFYIGKSDEDGYYDGDNYGEDNYEGDNTGDYFDNGYEDGASYDEGYDDGAFYDNGDGYADADQGGAMTSFITVMLPAPPPLMAEAEEEIKSGEMAPEEQDRPEADAGSEWTDYGNQDPEEYEDGIDEDFSGEPGESTESGETDIDDLDEFGEAAEQGDVPLEDLRDEVYIVLEVHKYDSQEAPLIRDYGLHLFRSEDDVAVRLYDPEQMNATFAGEDEEDEVWDDGSGDVESYAEEPADDFTDIADDSVTDDASSEETKKIDELIGYEEEFDWDASYTAKELESNIRKYELDVLQCQLDILKAEKDLKAKKDELDNSTVRAKLDGEVKTVRDPEEAKNNGTALVVVSSGEGGYYVSSSVGELDLDSVKVGTSVEISSMYGGGNYSGVVKSISDYPTSGENYFSYDSNTNSSYYPVEIRLEEGAELREDDYVDVKFSSNKSDGLFIDNRFIRSEGASSYCYVADENDRLAKRSVVTGRILDFSSFIEIKSGLTEGDRIAFPYGKDVVEGAAVQDVSYDEMYGIDDEDYGAY